VNRKLGLTPIKNCFKPLTRPRYRWKDNIETKPEEFACEDVGCIHRAQEMVGFSEHINELYGSTEGEHFFTSSAFINLSQRTRNYLVTNRPTLYK